MRIPSGTSDLLDICGELRAETESAYQFYDGARTVWLPKSQCQWDVDAGEMTMPSWLAKDKGLI